MSAEETKKDCKNTEVDRHTYGMMDTFKSIAGFLDRFESEVEGRGLQEPPDEQKVRLQRFARGELPAPEHAGVLEALTRNPQWVAWLAQEVKAMRASKGD